MVVAPGLIPDVPMRIYPSTSEMDRHDLSLFRAPLVVLPNLPPEDDASTAAVVSAVAPAPATEPQDAKAMMIVCLKEIFASEGVPPELVWIAEVESRLDPQARSHAGALGLFQIMPETARRFGLRLGQYVDERYNPEKSAGAAARYLRTLYQEFGSWQLAVAAYNAGEGRVGRALRWSPTGTFEEIAPRLPAETRNYVPRVMMVVSDREGRDASSLPPPM